MRINKLEELLKDKFGHGQFRLNQLSVIESVLDGQDTLAIMPTGGGKSVCYQIPALYSDGICLVISPLISLMADQVLNLKQNGIDACFLNSSQDYEQRQEAIAGIRNGKIKLVYASPEGIISGSLSPILESISISLIAIDEAHCVSQWGHEFRSDYMKLGQLKEMFKDIPILALTATADEKTRKDIAVQLRMNEPQEFVSSFDRPNIKYKISERADEINQLIEFIKSEHPEDTGIIYCLSRKKVEKVTKELNDRGYSAVSYHAGLSAQQRANAQELFNTKDQVIVVATIAFGMGIDRPDVRFVAHMDLPKSIESYYQETGRAGRDGLDSTAWMIFGLQDVIKLSQMLETTEASETYKTQARLKLDSMLALCESITCRRRHLLDYFGEDLGPECGNCDSCLEPPEKIDATVNAQKMLSAIYRTGQVFGAQYIIDVLRESKNAKVIERGHDQLSCYGIGKDESKSYWNAVLRQLLNQGFIRIKSWEYRNLALNPKAADILKSEKTFEMKKPKFKSDNTKSRKSVMRDESHERMELFEQLRSLRMEIAKEEGIPPFMIFADRSLHDMCHLLPRNESEFLMVNGVGNSKCEKYSNAFLVAISKHS